MGCTRRERSGAPYATLFPVKPSDVEAFAGSESSVVLYGMYLMGFDILMGLERMTPHQVLLSGGQLAEWSIDMLGRVVFVSHEWLAYEHPDPTGAQQAALQSLLSAMQSGRHRLQSDWRQQFVGSNETLPADRVAQAIPGCHFWLDYSGVPQLLPGEAPGGDTARKQLLAIRSIPAYVERSSIVLVLAPTCVHQDGGRSCNFSTWRSRGWCRVEMLCAALSKTHVRLLKFDTSSAAPTFMGGADVFQMPPGEGNFTCCSREHIVNGAPVDCDKAALRLVLEPMLDAAAQYHGRMEERVRQRLLICDKERLLRGLPDLAHEHAESPVEPEDLLSALRTRLQWAPEDDADSLAGRAPSLLHWAARAGDAAAIGQLLRGGPPQRGLLLERPMPLAGTLQWNLLPGLRPLQLAAHSADGRPDAMLALLDAKANASVWDASNLGYDALMWAAALGTLEQLRAWCGRFPGWNLERRSRLIGITPMALAAFNHPCSSARLRFLMGAGARARGGAGILSWVDAPLLAACSKDDSDPEAVSLLLAARCSPTARFQPTLLWWRVFLCGSRLAVRLSTLQGQRAGPLVRRYAEEGGASALTMAAVSGHQAVVELLLEARADPLQRNWIGRTPLESACLQCGGDLPVQMERWLSGCPPDLN